MKYEINDSETKILFNALHILFILNNLKAQTTINLEFNKVIILQIKICHLSKTLSEMEIIDKLYNKGFQYNQDLAVPYCRFDSIKIL